MTTNRKKLTADLIASVSFLGFAIFVYALSVRLPAEAAEFPKLISTALGCLSIVLIISTLRKKRLFYRKHGLPDTKDGETEDKTGNNDWKVELASFSLPALSMIFVLIVPVIGFEFAAFLFMTASLLILGKRKALRYFYIPLLVPLILTLVFRTGLHIRLPSSFKL